MTGDYKYKAFISYSHRDRKWGAWLHRMLEQFEFPKDFLRTSTRISGQSHLLRPIFRDREELSVGHNLATKIEGALRQSECLIVICSPESARSHWVNKEILFFKQQNRAAKIFSVIIAGEPNSGKQTECFPDALRYKINSAGILTDQRVEPLAADLRDSGDGKRLGLLKLVAGLVGTDLDALVQRDLKRNRQRVIAVTLTSFTLVSVMGALLINAMTARQEAEKRREVAEEQIEFMLTDLKDEVKKVGRLDVLDSVIQKASDYYENFAPTVREPKAYQRLSRVNMNLGQIALEYGDSTTDTDVRIGTTQDYFQNAYGQAEELYKSNPKNPDYVYNYAQATYWLGSLNFKPSTSDIARGYLNKYVELTDQLETLEKNTLRARIEPVMSAMNIIAWEQNFSEGVSSGEIDDLVRRFEMVYEDFTGEQEIIKELAFAYAWQADVHEVADASKSLLARQKQLSILQIARREDPQDNDLMHSVLLAVSGVTKALLNQDRFLAAKEVVDFHIDESERLWRLNPSSEFYLENYVWLNFYLAKAEFALGDDASVKQRIALIQRLKATSAVDFSQKLRVFEQIEGRLPQSNSTINFDAVERSEE